LRIAGAVGDGAVESEILLHGIVAALDGSLDRLIMLDDLLELRRRRPLRAEAGGLDLGAGAQLHDVEDFAQRRMLVEIDPEWPADTVGDEGADALPRDDQPVRPQGGHRFPDHGAGNAGRRDHFLLSRQPRPRRQFAAGDVGREPSHELSRQTARRGERL
jgi:hypothetical protein